ncbi:MAG: glycosyltransferase [Bacteroidia bacterium]|nr:glycosyltransferase [Bacteroidia bacterium]
MSSPFFSVIIPTYNREEFILKSIQSVLEQKYTDFEILVIDDGSTDNSSKIIKPYLSDKLQYFFIENSERGAARNYGMSKASGNYITFLDSDDIYYSNYLDNAFACINKLNQPEFFAQAYEKISPSGKKLGKTLPGSRNYFEAISKGNFLSCMGVFLAKSVIVQLKFNEDRNLSGSEDWEYWVRVMAQYDLKYSAKVCSAMIIHEDRSVLAVSEESLVNRRKLAMKYAFENSLVEKKFSNYKSLMNANWDTYVALHLMLDKQLATGLKHFKSAFFNYPFILFTKRSLVIIKLAVQKMMGLR